MSRVRPARGAASRRSGRRAEVPAALWLMAKGYRILGLRLRTPLAAIDRLGLRGKIRSLVEAERRTSLPIARQSVTFGQGERLRRAGAATVARRPRLSVVSIHLDLMTLAPGKLPRHIPDAWKGS